MLDHALVHLTLFGLDDWPDSLVRSLGHSLWVNCNVLYIWLTNGTLLNIYILHLVDCNSFYVDLIFPSLGGFVMFFFLICCWFVIYYN